MSTRTGFLGILMLHTRFPRPLGDVGHPGSWRMPVRLRTVQDASAQRVLGGDVQLLQPFIVAAQTLVKEGASAITTSCGVLINFQAALQAAVPVPMWTSSLLALPQLKAPGVVTVDAQALGPPQLRAAGAEPSTPVQGLQPGCHLQRTLLEDRLALDQTQACADTVAAARALLLRHPEVENLVFECTNLPPYAAAVQRATGRPVHHLMTLVHERWNALP